MADWQRLTTAIRAWWIELVESRALVLWLANGLLGRGRKDIRVGIFMMQKNERLLFPTFIRFYGQAFGFSNIHVFDNGSASDMLPLLEEAKELGVNVYTEYPTPEDFERKGEILGRCINENRLNYDVFLPLDCDEFVGLEKSTDLFTCDPDKLRRYFSQLKPGAYRTHKRFRNHPRDLEKFALYSGVPKIFLVDTEVSGLDVGLHNCQKPSIRQASSLCHFEFHNKPFQILREHARQKMRLRVDIEDTEALRNYKGKGVHLIPILLPDGETTYRDRLQTMDWTKTQAISKSYSELGLPHPFSNEVHLDLSEG